MPSTYNRNVCFTEISRFTAHGPNGLNDAIKVKGAVEEAALATDLLTSTRTASVADTTAITRRLTHIVWVVDRQR